jgi:hypothetical protein
MLTMQMPKIFMRITQPGTLFCRLINSVSMTLFSI